MAAYDPNYDHDAEPGPRPEARGYYAPHAGSVPGPGEVSTTFLAVWEEDLAAIALRLLHARKLHGWTKARCDLDRVFSLQRQLDAKRAELAVP